MNNILYFDPTQDQRVILILLKSGRIFKITKRYSLPLGEVLLEIINDFLKSAKVNLKQLQAITVVIGPGSFSSLRIGVVVANTLAWALKIPVFGLKAGELKNERELFKIINNKLKNIRKRFKIVLPFYNQEPNITWPES